MRQRQRQSASQANPTDLVRVQAETRGRGDPRRGAAASPADQECPSCGNHSRTRFVQFAVAQHAGRRTVVELRIEALEPRLCELPTVGVGQDERDLERDAKSLLDGFARDAAGFSPLTHRTRLSYAPDVRDQPSAKELAQLLRDLGERCTRGALVGGEVRP